MAQPLPLPTIEAGIEAIQKRWPELVNNCMDDPIFICAAGWRSGSTFLQRLLTSECFIWGEPYGHAELIDSLAYPIRCFTGNWPEPHFFPPPEVPRQQLARNFIANLYPSVEQLRTSYQQFFSTLFGSSAFERGFQRWGMKEVRLTIDHAVFLKWLFPRAKFLFLYRNPYDAWRSLAARLQQGWKWYKRWPHQPLSARRFAEHWRDCVHGFREGHHKVDGLLVKYEDLCQGHYQEIEDYLGFRLNAEAGEINPSDGGPARLESISTHDADVLHRILEDLPEQFGYQSPIEHRPPAVVDSVTFPDLADKSKTVILMPVGNSIEPICDDALRYLESQGYQVRRVFGYAAIDQGRNQMATDALGDGFDELIWIDSDVSFHPNDVDKLRSHRKVLVSGIYPHKGRRRFACNFGRSQKEVVFGAAGGLVPLERHGFGFTYTHRVVYETMERVHDLKTCNEEFGRRMLPYFIPTIVPDDNDGYHYLAEDYAFCERARQCGIQPYGDTTIRLWHIGKYQYGWEDAGELTKRFPNYSFKLLPGGGENK